MKTTVIAAAVAATTFFSMPAAAATVDFGADSRSTNDSLTGASASFDFSFSDSAMADTINLLLTATNTTGTTIFGAGATEATITSFGFDLVAGSAFGSFVPEGKPATNFATFNGEGISGLVDDLEVALGTGKNLNGGNTKSGIKVGQDGMFAFMISTTLTAAEYDVAFMTGLTKGTIDAAVRFQGVNAGEGSDKLAFDGSFEAPAEVPLPAAGFLLLAGLGGLGAISRRRKVA